MSIPPGAVDTHAHVFEPELPMEAGRRYTPAYAALLSDYLTQLDHNGLERGVLVQPSFLGTDNSYLVDALRRAEGRCKGVAQLMPDVSPAALSKLDSAGITGMRLNLMGRPEPDLRDPAWRDLLKELNHMGWHIELHCPHTQLPAVLAPLLEADCRVVVDHFGRPDFKSETDLNRLDYLCTQGASGQLWVKISAPYRIWESPAPDDYAAAIGVLLSRLGAERLMWGSDWPHTQFEEGNAMSASLSFFLGAISDPDVVTQVLAKTPHTFFGF